MTSQFTWDRKNVPGGNCDSSDSETNKQVEKQRRALLNATWTDRQQQWFDRWNREIFRDVCACVCTLSRSCGVADSRLWPLVTQWRARMPYWPSPISSSQSHTCSVFHLEKGIFKFLTWWGGKTEDEKQTHDGAHTDIRTSSCLHLIIHVKHTVIIIFTRGETSVRRRMTWI